LCGGRIGGKFAQSARSKSQVARASCHSFNMHALFQGMALRDLHVRDAMAKDIHVCHPGDSFAQAEKTMQEARIRRLPVIDEKGSLVGMISLADLAKLAARERAHPRKDITETEIGDTLATICGAPTWSIAV
jgi:CBS-domain-containing membrane protein